jgi:hypothetical protein
VAKETGLPSGPATVTRRTASCAAPGMADSRKRTKGKSRGTRFRIMGRGFIADF